MNNQNSEQTTNKISVGMIISREQLTANPIIPKEIVDDVEKAPFYLFIYISREEVIKISVFPSRNDNIKKILIKLKEFSPDLVKGISGILKEMNLSKKILHTTGLCYEMEKCFYETYLVGDDLESDEKAKDTIKGKFMSIAKVLSVEIVDIPPLKK